MNIDKNRVYTIEHEEFKTREWERITKSYNSDLFPEDATYLKNAMRQLDRDPSIEYIQIQGVDEDGVMGIMLYRSKPQQRFMLS